MKNLENRLPRHEIDAARYLLHSFRQTGIEQYIIDQFDAAKLVKIGAVKVLPELNPPDRKISLIERTQVFIGKILTQGYRRRVKSDKGITTNNGEYWIDTLLG